MPAVLAPLLPFYFLSFSAELNYWQREIVRYYSQKLSYNKRGIPEITVGLGKGLTSLAIILKDRTDVRYYPSSKGGERVISLPKGYYRISIRWGRPGHWYYLVAPFILSRSKVDRWYQLSSIWKRRGFFISPLYLGTTFFIGKQIYDNRRVAGVIAQFSSFTKARNWANSLEKRWRQSFFIVPKLALIPSIQLILTGNGRRLFSHGLFYFIGRSRAIVIPSQFLGVKSSPGNSFLSYRGDISILPDQNGKIAVVNIISLPNYLAGVLPSEMPLWAPREALRAQTVCARSEILSKIGLRHLDDPYLFCSEVHCQVYRGIHVRERRASQIVSSTEGIVLLRRDGTISDASYSAICGGHTENNEFVWGGPPDPSLRGRPDLYSLSSLKSNFFSPLSSQLRIWRWLLEPPKAYCNLLKGPNRKLFRWYKTPLKLDLAAVNSRPFGLSELSSDSISRIEVLKRGVSGRAYKIAITFDYSGKKRRLVISGELNIRRLFGNLPSSMFVVRRRGEGSEVRRELGRGKSRAISHLIPRRKWEFVGGGWGHGVGMCQYGAMGRARRGSNYRQILKAYFSSIQLKKLY